MCLGRVVAAWALLGRQTGVCGVDRAWVIIVWVEGATSNAWPFGWRHLSGYGQTGTTCSDGAKLALVWGYCSPHNYTVWWLNRAGIEVVGSWECEGDNDTPCPAIHHVCKSPRMYGSPLPRLAA